MANIPQDIKSFYESNYGQDFFVNTLISPEHLRFLTRVYLLFEGDTAMIQKYEPRVMVVRRECRDAFWQKVRQDAHHSYRPSDEPRKPLSRQPGQSGRQYSGRMDEAVSKEDAEVAAQIARARKTSKSGSGLYGANSGQQGVEQGMDLEELEKLKQKKQRLGVDGHLSDEEQAKIKHEPSSSDVHDVKLSRSTYRTPGTSGMTYHGSGMFESAGRKTFIQFMTETASQPDRADLLNQLAQLRKKNPSMKMAGEEYWTGKSDKELYWFLRSQGLVTESESQKRCPDCNRLVDKDGDTIDKHHCDECANYSPDGPDCDACGFTSCDQSC